MERQSHNWKRIAAAGIALAIGSSACQRKSAAPLPDVSALRQALLQTATAALPAPTLVNRSFSIAVEPGEIPAKTTAIVKAAGELQGTVLSNAGGILLISLPGGRLGEFASRALGRSVGPEESPVLPVLLEVKVIPISHEPAGQ